MQLLAIAIGGLIGWRLRPGNVPSLPSHAEFKVGRRLSWTSLALFGGLLALLPALARAGGNQKGAIFESFYRAGSLGFGGEESAGATFLRRDGKVWTQTYERGKPTTTVKTIAKAQLPDPTPLPWAESERVTGTVTRFAPDPQMFPIIEWDAAIVEQWLRETAYLNKGLFLSLHDDRDGSDASYYFDGGIVSFVRHLNRSHQALHKPVYADKTYDNGTVVEAALQ